MASTDSIFSSYDPTGSSIVPMTQYQEYCVRRFRLDRDLDTRVDHDRFRALLWYIEGYGGHRKPLKTPYSAAQIQWMLEPQSPYISPRPLPRIIDAIVRRSLFQVNAYAGDAEYLVAAYWWSIEFAPLCNVEHFLIPTEFIAALKQSVQGSSSKAPINEFLKGLMERRTDVPWSTTSETERLACYVRVLLEPLGTHYALFFPDSVLSTLGRPVNSAASATTGLLTGDLAAVHARIQAAKAYALRHKQLRSGQHNVSAPLIDRGWEKVMAKPAPPAARRAVAPKPEGFGSALPVPLRVIGPVNSQSGLGQATRMTIESLVAVGVQPQLLDFYLDNPAPRRAFLEGGGVTRAFKAINLVHLNAESVPLAPAYLPPEIFEGAYNIGYFFWELPRAARCHHLALELLDEIWVSSEFNVGTYQSLTDKPVRKMGMAVETLPDAAASRSAVRKKYEVPAEAFVFMSTFDSYSFIKRKNPAGVLRAFLRAFDGADADVRLIIKTHNLTAILGEPHALRLVREITDLVHADPRILLIDQTLPFTELLALKAACDCYVSLHRSEGWGFGAVEAMQLGLPVIATAFSGNLEFCTPDTAYNIGYQPLYLERDDYIFVQAGDWWADPDLDEAARAMRHVVAHPEEARAKGQAARAFVERNFSHAAVGNRFVTRLKEIAQTGLHEQPLIPDPKIKR